MKISFKNNNISISQEGINLDSYGSNNFFFIAEDQNSLDSFIGDVGDYAYDYESNAIYEYVSSNFWNPVENFDGFLPTNFSDWSSKTRYYDIYAAANEFYGCGLNVETGIHALEKRSSANDFLFESFSGLLGNIPSTFDLYLNIPSLFGASIRLIKNGTALSIPSQFSGVVTNISNTEVTFSNGDKITKDTSAVKTTATSTTGQINWNSKVLWKDRNLGFKENDGFIKLTDVKLTLFSTGDQKTSLTGGWVEGETIDNGGSVSIGINLEIQNTGSGQKTIVTDIKVKKPFHAKFLKVKWYSPTGSSTVQAFLAISTGTSKNFSRADATASVASPFYNNFSVRTDTLDISSIQDDFYISILGESTSGSGLLIAEEIWFEE